MPQEITENETEDAANSQVEVDLGEDEDALPDDQLPHEATDPPLIEDRGGFESVLDDDLQQLDLNEPAPDTGGEEV
jgi:hypothetical protein